MKKDDAILLLTALTLAELTLLVILAYRYYQEVAPQLQGVEKTASGIGSFLSLLTGSSTTKAP